MITAVLHLFGAVLGIFGALVRVAFHLPLILLGLPLLVMRRRHLRSLLFLAGIAALIYHVANRRRRVIPPRIPGVIDI